MPNSKENAIVFTSKIDYIIKLAEKEAEYLFPTQSRADVRVADRDALKVVQGRSSRNSNDTLIYVINYQDNNGFALVSATDMPQPILAVVPKGEYNPEIGTDNPGFNMFLEAAKQKASNYSSSNLTEIGKFELDSTDWGGYNIEDGMYHKIESNIVAYSAQEPWTGSDFAWSQDGIYGHYCPNGLCGCVPLTIGTLMAYFRGLTGNDMIMSYSFPESDVNDEALNFKEMLKHRHSEEYYDKGNIRLYHDCTAVEVTHGKIGRFLRQIGRDAGPDALKYHDEYINGKHFLGTYFYPGNGTTYYNDLYTYVWRYLSPYETEDFKDYNFEDAKAGLDKGILFMEGHKYYDWDSDMRYSYDGHAWYCDGYEYYKVVYTEYVSNDPSSGPFAWLRKRSWTEETKLTWMHWGWGGQGDGWYEGTVLDPSRNGMPYKNLKFALVKFQNQ